MSVELELVIKNVMVKELFILADKSVIWLNG